MEGKKRKDREKVKKKERQRERERERKKKIWSPDVLSARLRSFKNALDLCEKQRGHFYTWENKIPRNNFSKRNPRPLKLVRVLYIGLGCRTIPKIKRPWKWVPTGKGPEDALVNRFIFSALTHTQTYRCEKTEI